MSQSNSSNDLQKTIARLAKDGVLFDPDAQRDAIENNPAEGKHLRELFDSLNQSGVTLDSPPNVANENQDAATVPPGQHVSGLTKQSAAGVTPSVFGDYELQELLGQGGMGVVYRAHQKSLDRDVALKMIRDVALASDDQISRFETEAKAAANLDHPGIVPVYEFGELEGRHFLALGLIEGENLSERLKQGPVDSELAIELTSKLADSVQYAHSKGVVHRDLKPANILIDPSGQPRITDFGLARLESNQSQTLTGEVLGTPAYMAPEQAAGLNEKIGPTTDVYALGAILYHLVTGRPPFQSATAIETLTQVLTADVKPIREIEPSISKDLEAVCLKCLNKDAKLRYQTAAELSDDLERVQQEQPVKARPAKLISRLRIWSQQERRIHDAAKLMVATAVMTVFCAVAIHFERLQSKKTVKREIEVLHQRFNYTLIAGKRDELRQELKQLTEFGKLIVESKPEDEVYKDYFRAELKRVNEELELIKKHWRVMDPDSAERAASAFLDLKRRQDNFETRTQWMIQDQQSKVVMSSMAVGTSSLFALVLIGNAVAFFKDPRSATMVGLMLIGVVFAIVVALILVYGSKIGFAPFFQLFVVSPVSFSFAFCAVIYASLVSMGGVAFFANREKLAYRRLGLRTRDSEAEVFSYRVFSPVTWVASCVMLAIILPGFLCYLLWLWNDDQSQTLINNMNYIWLLLGVLMFASFSLEALRMLSTVRRIAVSKNGWAVDNGIGATFESRNVPDISSTSLLEAVLMQVTAGFFGGRVRQNFDNAKYFIIRIAGRRLLFVPKQPQEFLNTVRKPDGSTAQPSED